MRPGLYEVNLGWAGLDCVRRYIGAYTRKKLIASDNLDGGKDEWGEGKGGRRPSHRNREEERMQGKGSERKKIMERKGRIKGRRKWERAAE